MFHYKHTRKECVNYYRLVSRLCFYHWSISTHSSCWHQHLKKVISLLSSSNFYMQQCWFVWSLPTRHLEQCPQTMSHYYRVRRLAFAVQLFSGFHMRYKSIYNGYWHHKNFGYQMADKSMEYNFNLYLKSDISSYFLLLIRSFKFVE